MSCHGKNNLPNIGDNLVLGGGKKKSLIMADVHPMMEKSKLDLGLKAAMLLAASDIHEEKLAKKIILERLQRPNYAAVLTHHDIYSLLNRFQGTCIFTASLLPTHL